jgi:predicted DNA-binding transcriptional regulator AlpA
MGSSAKLDNAQLAQPTRLDPLDILTPEQLADRLQVKKSWIFEQTRARSKTRNAHPLPCIRLGKYIRFSWSQVSEWMQASQEKS